MTVHFKVLRDVEAAITAGSLDHRSMLLRHVTDLFVIGSESCSDEEIALFDDVFIRLATEIEISARALLALRLSAIPHAPPKIISTLASDDAIEVAAPILMHSPQLDDPTLVETARNKGQEHLLAISQRQLLNEPVTDVLVERGDQQVVLSTAKNPGARFSDTGFTTLVHRSDGDDELAACVGSRPDIPAPMFIKLLQKASQHVRAKLEAEYPHARPDVQRAVGEITDGIEARFPDRLADGVEASASIEALHRSGQLNHDKI